MCSSALLPQPHSVARATRPVRYHPFVKTGVFTLVLLGLAASTVAQDAVSVAPALMATTGRLYLLLAIIPGLAFYYVAYRASVSRTKLAAKQLLHASVIYLPLLYLAMLIDKIK